MSSLSRAQFLEAVLRDEGPFLDQVRNQEPVVSLVARALTWTLVGCVVFGASLGIFSGTVVQVAVSAVKVPLLLLGSAVLCFPTFHVVQVMRATRPVSFAQAAAVQARALTAIAITWAAFAPPLFFLVSTTSHYRLAQALALLVGAIGGVVGFRRLVLGYQSICVPHLPSRFIYLYLAVFGAVGSQLAWVLRPFVGSPELGFQLFRTLEGSIFEHVLAMLAL